ATSMRIDAARLSGRAGLGPGDTPRPDATGEHAWHDILDAAESSSRVAPLAAASSASLSRTSDSAITRVSGPEDSSPTLPYGLAGESAARWAAPPPAPAPAP